MSDKNTGLAKDSNRQYSEDEARDAFDRMVSKYGWNK